MNIERILVTGANGDIANAIGRLLKSAYPGSTLFGADLGNKWPGQNVFLEMHTLPRADDPTYIDALLGLAKNLHISCIIPCTEPELHKLISEWDKVCQLPLLMNEQEVIDTGLDKVKTMKWLNSIGIGTPLTTLLADAKEKDLPLFIKPRSGSGSRNLQVIHTAEHLTLYKKENNNLDLISQKLLEPHLGEYTCALFKYKDDVRTLIMRRWLSGGLTSRMIVENVPEIEKALHTIADSLPNIAVINVQLRLTDSGPLVFEINPRLSSTVMMRHKIGFKDLEWWLDVLNDKAPASFDPPIGYRVYRTYDELVVSP